MSVEFNQAALLRLQRIKDPADACSAASSLLRELSDALCEHAEKLDKQPSANGLLREALLMGGTFSQYGYALRRALGDTGHPTKLDDSLFVGLPAGEICRSACDAGGRVAQELDSLSDGLSSGMNGIDKNSALEAARDCGVNLLEIDASLRVALTQL